MRFMIDEVDATPLPLQAANGSSLNLQLNAALPHLALGETIDVGGIWDETLVRE